LYELYNRFLISDTPPTLNTTHTYIHISTIEVLLKKMDAREALEVIKVINLEEEEDKFYQHETEIVMDLAIELKCLGMRRLIQVIGQT